MKYIIKYNYDTGDSFDNYPGQEDVLELTWENLEIAKANLKRIEEHYRMYQALNSWGSKRDSEQVRAEHESKDWFVNDAWGFEYSLKLYTDDGKPWQLHAPWCGYFEHLNFVEIVPEQSDMKIEF